MTNDYELADDSRESLIWTKEQLLAPLEPAWRRRRTRCGSARPSEDYYLRLGGHARRAQAEHAASPVRRPAGEAPA